MITVDEALRIVLDNVEPLGAETVRLESALNRILAQDIHADMDLPPFDRARMDGYALRAADAAAAPARLQVIGEVAAGACFDGELERGQAVKIFTGAPVPAGADAVQKVEVTQSDGQSVIIKEPVEPGQFITARASEVQAGEIVAQAGCEIGPAQMSVLASFGYAEVKAGLRPRVAIISTGSELVPVGEKPAGAQIRNSNSYTIAAYAERAGATTTMLETIEDSLEATEEALKRAAEQHHVVITSGGVSMGDYDLVKAALKQLGAQIFFDKVMIRPGKPTVFARSGDAYFFGLPGNPVSTSVTFNLFARPAIRKLQGDLAPVPAVVRAEVRRAVRDSSSRRSYLPATLYIKDGRAAVEPLKWGGSSDLVAFMKSNALIIVPEQVREIAEGHLADVLVLDRI